MRAALLRLAFAHPIWITLIVCGGLATGAVALAVPLMSLLLGFAILMTLLLWVHGIYLASRLGLSPEQKNGRDLRRVFFVCEIGIVALSVLRLATVPSIFADSSVVDRLLNAIGTLCFLACWWVSARAFAIWKSGKPASFDQQLGWFIAFIYPFISAWVMRPHLQRLQAQLTNTSQTKG